MTNTGTSLAVSAHRVRSYDDKADWYCTCGELLCRDGSGYEAVRDAHAKHIDALALTLVRERASKALRDAARDMGDVWGGGSGAWYVQCLNERADKIDSGEVSA